MAIRVKDLVVAIAGKNLLDNISFETGINESVAIMGESGAGKTLLALSLLGLFPHNASVGGEINIFGKNILNLTKRELTLVRGKEIALVFQEPSAALNPLMSVYKQIAEPLLIHRLARAKEAKEKAIFYLGQVGINDYEKKAFLFPHQLSGGEKQRVLIAQALITEPKLLITDEPTAALDPILKLQIIDLLTNMTKKIGASLFVVTHELPVAKLLCSKMGILRNGRICEFGPLDSLLASPADDYTKSLLTNNLF